MSTTIDNRVVQMTFDNQDFEQKAQQSMSTLDKLTNALKLGDTTEGLKEFAEQADRTKLTGLQNGILEVQNKFSALQAVAFTCLQNITNTALNAGKNIVNALAVEPVTTGFEEYETQINAIQTILSNTRSKGTTIDDVNRSLDELNRYADKTIYNFTEMTRNIGTFTAAGIELQPAANAIQGIANLAAVSGSSAQQASTAMYQLSQALAAGRVSLQDWNSVVNAGMGGEVFQEALKRTSRVMGTGVDEAIAKYGTFRESLTKGGWLTKEVLTETLNQLANVYTEADLVGQGYSKKEAAEILSLAKDAEDAATKVKTLTQLWDTLTEAAQSGWTASWEILVGDFYQARDLLTGISDAVSDIINAQSDARNALLTQAFGKMSIGSDWWDRLTGQGMGLNSKESIKNMKVVASSFGMNLDKMSEEAGSFKATLKDGWLDRQTFGTLMRWTNGLNKNVKTTQEGANESKRLTAYTRKLIKGEYKDAPDMLGKIEKSGRSVDAIYASISERLHNAGTSLANLDTQLLENKGFSKEQIANIQLFAEAYEQAGSKYHDVMVGLEKETGRDLGIEGITNLLKLAAKALGAVGQAWKDAFGKIDAYGVYEAIEAFRDWTRTLHLDKEALSNITATFTPLFLAVKLLLKGLGALARIAFEVIKIGFRGIGFLLRIINGIITFVRTVKMGVSSSEAWAAFLERVGDAAEYLKGSFANFVSAVGELMGRVDKSDKFKTFIGDMAELSAIVALFAVDKFTKLIGIIGGLLNTLGSMMPSISVDQIASFLGGIGDSIHNFFSKGDIPDPSAKDSKLGQFGDNLDNAGEKIKDRALKAKANILLAFTNLRDLIAKIPDYLNFDQMQDVLRAGVFIYFIAQLASIFKRLKKITKDGGKITEGLKQVLDETADTLQAYQTQIKADAIKTIAEAIAILAGSMFVLSIIPSEKLAHTTVYLGVIMLIFALIVKLAMGAKSASEALAENAGGLPEQLAKFVDGIKETITKSAKVVAFGAFAVLLSAAIAILVVAITKLAGVKWTSALKGVFILLLITGILVAASLTLAKLGDGLTMGIGIAIAGIANGVLTLAQAVAIFSVMDPWDLAQGLGSVVAILLSMSLLSKASQGNQLISLSIGMVIMSGALLLLIPAITAFSALPFTLFAKGMGLIFATSALIAVASSLAANMIQFGVGLLFLAGAINLLIPPILALGAAGPVALVGILAIVSTLAIITFLGTIAEGAAVGLQALGLACLEIAGAMALAGVGFLSIGLGVTFFAGGLAILATALPGVAQGIVSFCQTISQNAGVILQGLSTIVIAIAAAIFASAGPIAAAVIGVLLTIIGLIQQYGPIILQAIGSTIASIWAWLTADLPAKALAFGQYALTAIWNIIKVILSFLASAIPAAVHNLGAIVLNGVLDFLSGLAEKMGPWGKKLAGILKGWKQPLKEIFKKDESKKDSKEWGEGAYEGVKEGTDKIAEIDLNGTFKKMTDGVDLKGAMKKISKDGVDGFDVSGLDSKINKTKSAMKSIDDIEIDTSGSTKAVKSLTKSLGSGSAKDFTKAGKTSGTALIKSLTSAISSGGSKVKSTASNAASKGASGARSKRGEFQASGRYLIQGLVNGLRSGDGAIRAAAIHHATLYNNTFRNHKATQINSPSKAQFKNGVYLVQGLVNGIRSGFSWVKNSAGAVANLVGTTLSRPIDYIRDSLAEDMTISPVISPVVDMDNVDGALNTIDSAFKAQTLHLGATSLGNIQTVQAANADIQNRNSNFDIIKQIKALGHDIANMPRNNYTVNGVTYDDGSNIHSAIETLIRATVVEGRA